MTLFSGMQHLCTFNIVASLIYHLLPKVLKSYTISASTFLDVPYWQSYSTNKFISYVVPGLSQWFFHFGKEILIAWTRIRWVQWMFQISHCQQRKSSVTVAMVWRLALSWKMIGFCTTKCHHFLLSPCDYDLFAKIKEQLWGPRYNARDELIRAMGRTIGLSTKMERADGVRRL